MHDDGTTEFVNKYKSYVLRRLGEITW